MTKAEAQRRIRIAGCVGTPGRGLKVRGLMRGTHELLPAGMTVDVFGAAAGPCADRDIDRGKDRAVPAHRAFAGTAGAVPGTAQAAASGHTSGCGWTAIGAAAPLSGRRP
jgi:hypothetical protein